jgi:hypothetical protein
MKATLGFASGLACGLALSTLGGCANNDVALARAEAERAVAAARQAEAEAQQRAERAEAAGDTKTAATERETAEIAGKVADHITRAVAAGSRAVNADGSITPGSVITAAAPFLPPPWNVIVLLGGTALTAGLGFLAEKRRRDAADAAYEEGKQAGTEAVTEAWTAADEAWDDAIANGGGTPEE